MIRGSFIRMGKTVSYIIVDLEWNQARSNREVVADSNGKKLYGEIIQIGAVRLSEKFKIADTFKINIRPKYYKIIHRKVRQITGISQETLAKGEEFLAAIEKFRKWCGDDVTFLTWGPDDARVMRRNIEMYNVSSDWVDNWYDLQMIYNMQTASGENQKSLSTAIEHFGIKASEPMHDALNDAYYTARVAEHLDVINGIAELRARARRRAILNEDHPLMCESYGAYRTRRDAFAEKTIAEVRCPTCGEICTDRRKWVAEGNDKYITLASCEEHGKYIIRLVLEKSDGVYKVSKLIFEAGDGAEAHYDKRVKRETSGRKRRKRRTKSAAPRKPQKLEKSAE